MRPTIDPESRAESRGITRRSWLRLAAVGATLALVAGVTWQYRHLRMRLHPIASHERAMLTRIVDLFIPRDETLGAVDLGVHEHVFGELEGNPARAQASAVALLDLDRSARAKYGTDFLALNAVRQEDLLQALGAAARSTGGGRFIRLLRHDVMRFYYAHPAVWPSLGFDGPPQPRGFPDYTEPPRPRA